MALPTIAINSGTGSDTAASGAGPSTALFGTAAATAASTTVTLLVDNPDLSGVATDGSAVIWIASSSGRRWSKITGTNNTAGVKTVTVESAYANTESGKSWGIGGKRATLNSSIQLGLDIRGGWTIDLQSDDTLTANFNLAPSAVTSNVQTLFTSTNTTRPTISTSTNSVNGLDIQNANNLVINHIHFVCTAGTKGDGIGSRSGPANFVIIKDCVIDGFAAGIRDHDPGGNNGTNGMIVSATEIKNCADGLNMWAGCRLTDVYSHNNTGSGLNLLGSVNPGGVNLFRCVFDSNAKYGVQFVDKSGIGAIINNCVFSNTTISSAIGEGLFLNLTSSCSVVIKNSIFYGNATYGLRANTTQSEPIFVTNCAWGSNSTANTLSITGTTGTNPITLTASPFVSSTDFGLNSTAGGGAACKGAAESNPLMTANSAGDVGAIPSGGGAVAGATAFAY